MTRARKVLVADRLKWASTLPIGVYGPTRNTSSSPMTSGGSSRLHSSPASHTCGNGSFPRASIQASGVPTRASTPRVTSPDSTETSSGSSAPGAVSELAMALADRWVKSAITGPSKASQTTAAAITETTADAERARRWAPMTPWGPARRGRRGGGPPETAPPAAAAGLGAQLTRDRGRDRALVPDHGRGEHGESARLVQGQAGRRQRVLDERGPGRSGRADDGDVDHLGRARLGNPVRERHLRRRVLGGVLAAAQVDLRHQRDVGQVQLDRLGDERARRVELPRLERRVQRGLGVDLR